MMKHLLPTAIIALATVPAGAATAEPAAPSFRHDVMPVFFRAGCNAGTCHGSARGKDGFMLSLFGYDPAGDYRRTVEEMPGRRVNTAVPAESLLLLKAAGKVPHTGGKLFDRDSELYQTLLAWIAAGAPDDAGQVPEVTGIALPKQTVVFERLGQQGTARVTASYSDGTTRDVTSLALYGSNNENVAEIDRDGHVTARAAGNTHIFARFSRFTVGAEVLVLPPAAGFVWPDPPENNFIDQLVFNRLRQLRIAPSAVCDDETFLRRVTLDLAARPPTVEEYETFMADPASDKRTRKVDELLASDDFTDFFTAFWAELLRVKSGHYLGRPNSHKAAGTFVKWLRDQVAADRPFDEVVAEMTTASGSTVIDGPTNLYTMLDKNPRIDAKALAADYSQVFLGVRIQCAECHNHPFDRWTMDDYYGFVSFFTGVTRKAGSDGRDRMIFFDAAAPPAAHAVDGRPVPAKLLTDVEPVAADGDPREALAAWIRDPANTLFDRNVVNRLWARLLGRGIVEPIDDFRATNPPSNGPLLDALVARFVESGRRLRPIIRDICTSRVYQLSGQPTPSNAADTQNFSHAHLRRLRADVLLDAIVAVTGVPRRPSSHWPNGTKAIVYFNRNQYDPVGDRVLELFGQASRNSVCACDTSTDPSLPQVMHLLVGDTAGPRIRSAARNGVLKQIVAAQKTPEAIIEAIFIRVLSRRPTPEERSALVEVVAEGQTPGVYEDIFAGLIGSSEFLCNL